jgi:hypothetical protein
VLSTGVPYAYKRLGRPATSSISDKHDNKYSQTKSRHEIMLQEKINKLRKESIKRDNDENQVI